MTKTDGKKINKVRLDILQGGQRVFDGVVQQTGGEDFRRYPQFGEDLGNCQAVVDVGLARVSLLAAMGLIGHRIGTLDQLPIRKGVCGR